MTTAFRIDMAPFAHIRREHTSPARIEHKMTEITCKTCGEPFHGQVPCWTSAYNRADTESRAGNDAEATRLRAVSTREHMKLEREKLATAP